MTESWARAVLRCLGQFADQFAECFGRRVQRDAASQYLEGLFNDSERKSMQAMHGRLSDPGPYQGLQHFITHSPWPASRVWDRLRALVPERSGILAIDDTGLPKQGKHSVGVKRQYCGALGKIGNCQVAVSSALIAARFVWPLTCELYLPQDWLSDAACRTRVGIPDRVVCREKWRIALAHVLLNLDATAAIADLVRLARSRWPIEQQYRELKDELGFDHFEGRTLQGWTHHAVLTARSPGSECDGGVPLPSPGDPGGDQGAFWRQRGVADGVRRCEHTGSRSPVRRLPCRGGTGRRSASSVIRSRTVATVGRISCCRRTTIWCCGSLLKMWGRIWTWCSMRF